MNNSNFSGSEVLEYEESAHEANRFSVGIKGRGWLLSVLHNGEQFVEVQRENMRRLVACWNACAGIDTDLLEGFSPWFLARYPDRALAERRTLEGHNKELLTRLVQAIEASGYSVSGPTDSRAAEDGEPAWVCSARGAIANAQQRTVAGDAPALNAPISLLSERTRLKIAKYLEASFLREQNGAALRDLEESRSYAVELVTAILIENPEATGFDKHLKKIDARRRKQPV